MSYYVLHLDCNKIITEILYKSSDIDDVSDFLLSNKGVYHDRVDIDYFVKRNGIYYYSDNFKCVIDMNFDHYSLDNFNVLNLKTTAHDIYKAAKIFIRDNKLIDLGI